MFLHVRNVYISKMVGIPGIVTTSMLRNVIERLQEQIRKNQLMIETLEKEIVDLKQQLTALQNNDEEEDYDEELYQALRMERNAIAKENGIPPFCIFDNKTLILLCKNKPKTIEELKNVKGIKNRKSEQYGDRFLQILQKFETK